MTFRLRHLWRSAGFWTLMAGFLAANVWTVFGARSETSAGTIVSAAYGFPFPFLIVDSATAQSRFFLSGLLLDVVLPVTLGIVLVWLLRLMRRPLDRESE